MACIHPDGTHAVFWGGSAGRPRLWLADGHNAAEPITAPEVSARYPAFGLTGTLVYCRSTSPTETIEHLRRGRTSVTPRPGTTMSLVLRHADGRERVLTDGTHLDQRPALSPDGQRVAFVSDRKGSPGLWTVGTEEGDEPKPLLAAQPAYRPWWSVDGQRIFYIRLGPDRHQVHVMPVDGGDPVPLANDDLGDTHGPYADPDGRHLLVHSTRERATRPELGRWGLYELTLGGGPPVRLIPPGYGRGAHGTRARNGVVTFDLAWPSEPSAPARGRRPTASRR
jgi:dipeptidyl aminopeptidase/acylaminoacyl peptidase